MALSPAQVGVRIGDVVIATTLIAYAFPLMVLVGLAITLESSGPALCGQTRFRSDGRRYLLLKFRTVSGRGTHETSVGRFLRLTRIEELPQLINVLRGEVTLIGNMRTRRVRGLARWIAWATALLPSGALLLALLMD